MIKENAYIDFIINELRKGNVIYSKLLKVFLSKFKCSEPTFVTYWKKANALYLEERNKTNEKKERELEKHELKEIVNIVKTKKERLLLLQTQINDLIEIIEGKKNVTYIINNKVANSIQNDKLVLPIQVILLIQKNIKDLQVEISKIEGDYAPQKLNVTDDQGNAGLVVMSLSELIADVSKK